MEDLLDTDSKLDAAEIQASCCIRSKQLAIDIPFGLTTIRNTVTISISSTASFPSGLAAQDVGVIPKRFTILRCLDAVDR